MNSEAPNTHERQKFCLALKAARERKGISLAEISEKTKIAAAHFVELERNDLRHWPKGLFRRSFFRDYARAIDLPVAEACAEFVRLFPEEDGVEPSAAVEPAAPVVAAAETDVRLVLDEAWHGPHAPIRSRLLAALADAGAVTLVAVALAWVAGFPLPITLAIVALAYFSLATVACGSSLAAWAFSRGRFIIDVLAHGHAATAAAWRRGTGVISRLFDGAGGEPPDTAEQPARAWVSDARRVGPAPRLRVRIKMPH
ncbi:MAG: helix-turn-helix domain-containing protein [Vicinamibacterales bacterium]